VWRTGVGVGVGKWGRVWWWNGVCWWAMVGEVRVPWLKGEQAWHTMASVSSKEPHTACWHSSCFSDPHARYVCRESPPRSRQASREMVTVVAGAVMMVPEEDPCRERLRRQSRARQFVHARQAAAYQPRRGEFRGA